MTKLDIQKSQHLLKRLKEEMNFLSGLMTQAEYQASNIQKTWAMIHDTHENWEENIEKH